MLWLLDAFDGAKLRGVQATKRYTADILKAFYVEHLLILTLHCITSACHTFVFFITTNQL